LDWIGSEFSGNFMDWIGLDPRVDGLDWIGSAKWTHVQLCICSPCLPFNGLHLCSYKIKINFLRSKWRFRVNRSM